MWGTLIKIFSLSFFYDIINPLAFDFQTPWKYFLFFSLIITFIFLGGYFVKKFILKKKTKEINFYFVFGIYIFLFLSIFGFSFITQNYGSEFTQDIIWQVYQKGELLAFEQDISCSVSRLDCNSIGHYNKFVIGDEIYYQFSLT